MFRVPYRLARLIIDLLVLRGRRDRSKDAEILVLRHQLAVLHRQVPHPRFDDTDRTLMSALARVVDRSRWSAFIVKPATILAWHGRLVAKHWTYPHRRGRPATIVGTRRTIIRLARENPTWGYRRIHGELARLGITIAASTIWAILKRADIDPAPGRNSESWTTFLRSQAAGIIAAPPRTVRPHPHLEPPTTRTALTRGRRPLQRAQTASWSWATRTERYRSCRVSVRPADPTTLHLQRTHQPVPTSSLNPDNGQPNTGDVCFDAPAPPYVTRHQHRGCLRNTPNAFPAPTGTKFVLVAARNTDVDGRIILDIAWVPNHAGEAKTAIECFTRLAPLIPGAQGVIYDTVPRGVHHQTLLCDLGLLPVNRVTAAKAGSQTPRRSTGRREEKNTRVETKTITLSDGTTRTVELYARGGAVGIGELTERGDLHYTELTRIRTHRTQDTSGKYRWYNDYQPGN